MSFSRREFLEVLKAAAASGLPLASSRVLAQTTDAADLLYDLPRFGNVGLLHFTDTHAQLLPVWFREPHVNLGVAGAAGRPPHLVGDAFLREYGLAPGSRMAHALSCVDFEAAARTYGRIGGFA